MSNSSNGPSKYQKNENYGSIEPAAKILYEVDSIDIADASGSGCEKISSSSAADRPGDSSSNEQTSLSSCHTTAELSIPPSSSSNHNDMLSTLSFLQKFSYGLGHIHNDLCAGIWFSYTLIFMKLVLGLPAPEAGALVMLGQVIDAIATPIIGIFADRFGTKRTWHMIGTCLVFISFPMIFSICPWCKVGPVWWPAIYFSIFIIIFQIAWPIVQISHFAMIPELSKTTKDRADLTATRYSASIIANLIVYIIVWIFLNGRTNTEDTTIGPSDAYRFRDITLILTLIGITMSIVFQFSLSFSDYEYRRKQNLAAHDAAFSTTDKKNDNNDKHVRRNQQRSYNTFGSDRTTTSTGNDDQIEEVEPLLSSDNNGTGRDHGGGGGGGSINASNSEPNIMPGKRQKMASFIKSPLLYQNAFLYVFARLFMTTSLIYMPLWLDERSRNITAMNSSADNTPTVQHLATVPLVSFVSSFISSVLLKQTNQWMPHQLSYLIGSSVSLAGCIWIAFTISGTASSVQLYLIAILFGSGSSITMISSLCITADMVGKHTYQGGFIYSAVTFADKLITGIAVVIIEAMNCKNHRDCPKYYQNVLTYGCGIVTILGVLVLISLRCTRRRRLLTSGIY